MALSLTMVAAFLVGLIGFAYQHGTLDRLVGGPPDEPVRLPYAAFANQGWEDTFEVAEIPDASECTVDPLTVDEVIARFRGPQLSSDPGGSFGPGATPPAAGPAKVPSDATPPVEETQPFDSVDQENIDAIAARARQWLACQIAGDHFRAWSFLSTSMLQQTFFGIYGPQVSMETLQTDLQRLADGAIDTPFQPMEVAEDAFVPMVVTNGWNTFYPGYYRGLVNIAVYWTSLDGTVAAIPGYLTQDQWDDPAYELFRNSPNLPNTAMFIYDPRIGEWLLDDMLGVSRA